MAAERWVTKEVRSGEIGFSGTARKNNFLRAAGSPPQCRGGKGGGALGDEGRAEEKKSKEAGRKAKKRNGKKRKFSITFCKHRVLDLVRNSREFQRFQWR